MKSLLLVCLGASACATIAPASDVSSHSPRVASHALVQVAPMDEVRGFPHRTSGTELPQVFALRDWWRGVDHLTARLELCVAPNGKTARVHLAASSGYREYDEAVMRDAFDWRYEPFTSDGSSPLCEPATVTYLP